MKIKSRKYKDITRIIRLCCITGALFAYSSTAYATIAVGHNSLPVLDKVVYGGVTVPNLESIQNSTMNITQTESSAVIKWHDFSIGTNATVNFIKDGGGTFHVLNYVNEGGPVSQIYGNLNATNGNVYLVNPSGFLIGKSAEINVGELYVSNQKLTLPDGYTGTNVPNINGMLATAETTSAELMNLGHIKANQVTFVGDRVVLDLDYLKNHDGNQLGKTEIEVRTENIDNVVLGYTAYENGIDFKDENGNSIESGTYQGKDKYIVDVATVYENNTKLESIDSKKIEKAYMWVIFPREISLIR